MPVQKRSAAPAPPAATGKTAKSAPKKSAAGAKPAGPKVPAKSPTAAATHEAPAKRAATKKAAAPGFDVELNRAEIEREAYLIWAGRGHEHGQSQQDWLAAIELVKARQQS
jgi:hypothetical protein